jgi:histidine triad (HIT) family protein
VGFGAILRAVSDCPFCDRIAGEADIIHAYAAAVAFADAFRVTKGHVLAVPRRHLARLEDLDADEWAGVFQLVRNVCRELASDQGVDGVNVGLNSGPAAGQTSSTPTST